MRKSGVDNDYIEFHLIYKIVRIRSQYKKDVKFVEKDAYL